MTSCDPVWITEADVVALIDLPAAVEALEEALRQETEGGAVNMVKTQVAWDGRSLHATGAAAVGLAGTKTWVHAGPGASPLLVLFGSDDGRLRAVVEAFALGQLRTAAASAVATARLAREDADVLAICGTGEQALPQAAAVAAVRGLRQVRVFGRDPARRRAFAAALEADLGLAAEAFDTPAEAASGAGVVTVVTRAREPFLTAAMVEPGAHVNAVGAIRPDSAELEPALVGRCQAISVDSVAQARAQSRELRASLGEDEAAWARVIPLSRLVADGVRRPPGGGLTLFKPMGMGLADLALGARVYRQAAAMGRGRPLPSAARAVPELRRSTVGRGGGTQG